MWYRRIAGLCIVVLSALGIQGFAHATVIPNELLVEYGEVRQTLSVDESVPGAESRELIADDVELWSFADATEMKAAQEQLLEDPTIEHVEPNRERYSQVLFDDPILPKQWWIPEVKPQWLWWRVFEQKKSVVVAVIDSGIDLAHEDLRGRIEPGGYNFYANNTDVRDFNGHGTAVAGVIAATAGNQLGVAGITGTYKTSVLPLKISHGNGTSKVSDGIRALEYAIDRQVDVINLSYGSGKPSYLEEKAIQRAVDSGIMVVAAAGNDGDKGNTVMYPASYTNVLSVGATDKTNQRAYFSCYNRQVGLVAPGMSIYTTTIGNGYKSVSGTSFSSPVVAGAAALAKSLQPQLAPSDIRRLLEATATDLGPVGRDDEYGAGMLDMERLSRSVVDFTGDFTDLSALPDRIFRVTFNDELHAGKNYLPYIRVARTPDGMGRAASMTVRVNPANSRQLLVAPIDQWDTGVHYLRVDPSLQNKAGHALKKPYAVKFTVAP